MASRFAIETIFSARDRMTAPVTRMRSAISGMRKAAAADFRGMNDAVNTFNSSLINVAKVGLTSLIATGYAAIAVLKGMGDSLGDLNDEAIRLQFPIEELQIWRGIAKGAGIDNGELSASMAIFNKNLGLAKTGQGALSSGLKKSNPALLNQLKNVKNTAEAFDISIKAIRGQSDASSQAALATTLFGRSGGKLVNIARMGTEEIAALRKEMIENGIVTAQGAADADNFGDKLDSLTGAGMSLRNAALLPLMPILTQMAEEMRQNVNANRDLIATKVHETFAFARDNADNFMRIVSGLVSVLGAYFQIMIAVKGVMILMALWTGITTTATWLYTTALAIVNTLQGKNAAITAFSAAQLIIYYTVLTVIRTAILAFNIVMGIANLIMYAFAIAVMAGVSPVLLIIAGIAALAALAYLLISNWEPVTAFFSGIWDKILSIFETPIKKIKELLGGLFGGFGDILGGAMSINENATIAHEYGAPPTGVAAPSQVVTSSEQTISALTQIGQGEITINDNSGKASVTKQPKSGVSLMMRQSGAF